MADRRNDTLDLVVPPLNPGDSPKTVGEILYGDKTFDEMREMIADREQIIKLSEDNIEDLELILSTLLGSDPEIANLRLMTRHQIEETMKKIALDKKLLRDMRKFISC